MGEPNEGRTLAPRPTPIVIDVPVRGTFIDFGCHSETTPRCRRRSHSGLSTAPASLAGSVREFLDSPEDAIFSPVVTPTARRRPSEDSGSPSSNSHEETGSSAHLLPKVTYRLTPRSARAAGLWQTLVAAAAREERARVKAASTAKLAPPSTDTPECLSNSDNDEDDCSSDEEEDQGRCPQYSEDAELPSLGSAGHGEGTCRRCCFFVKGRCNNGFDCGFCHFAHEKRKSKSKNKKKHKKRRAKLLAQQAAARICVPGLQPRPVHIILQEALPAQISGRCSMGPVPVGFCGY